MFKKDSSWTEERLKSVVEFQMTRRSTCNCQNWRKIACSFDVLCLTFGRLFCRITNVIVNEAIYLYWSLCQLKGKGSYITCEGREVIGEWQVFFTSPFSFSNPTCWQNCLSPHRRCFTFAVPKAGHLPFADGLISRLAFRVGFNPRRDDYLRLEAEYFYANEHTDDSLINVEDFHTL